MILSLSIVALTACTATADPQVEATPARKIDLVRTSRVSSLQELTRQSAAVIIATAKQSRVEESHGIPVTVTEVERTRTITGNFDAPTAAIWQLGSTEVASPQTAQLLATGHTYLVFLTKEHSDGADRLVLTGADGLYKLDGTTYQYAGAPNPNLPQALPTTSAEATIKTAAQK